MKEKRKKLGYQEGFADYVARFIVGCVVGVILAFGAMVWLDVEKKSTLISIVIGSGFVASVLWNSFWRFIEFLAKVYSWPRY